MSDNSPQRPLAGMLEEEILDLVVGMGERPYRAEQLLKWIHQKGILDPAEMTNISKKFRARLSEKIPPVEAKISEIATSKDGTRKLKIEFGNGGAVETVLIPDGKKLTQCISTQVGCAFRCAFCLSGSHGLERNLKTEEILAQIHLGQHAYNEGEKLRNLVMMGSGEPLANYEETARALRLIINKKALNFSTRKVNLSTIGLPKGIRRLGEDFQGNIGLAVSLHGPDDETRAKLLPKLKVVPTDKVVEALRHYPLPPRRRITVEYVLVRGINDSEDHARKLVRTLNRVRMKINLIPFNPHHGCELKAPLQSVVDRFENVLLDKNMTVMIRKERGADIGAACGQLIARSIANQR